MAVTFKDKPIGQGPLQYGLVKGPITVAEIAECLGADPQGENDVPDNEQANRRVVPYGVISQIAATGDEEPVVLRTLSWPWRTFAENETLVFWVKNIDGAAFTVDEQVFFTIAAVTEWLM